MARRLTARPLPAWIGDLPVFERKLDNGLKALALPRTQAPVVVCDLYYPVGSVNEPPGQSGLAHFVEHMLFKGTRRLPKGQIDRLAFLAAGQSNAETGEDLTHYWFAFPRDCWELALAIEADRMHEAVFDPREVESERHVIVEERARELDSPQGRLDQNHLAVSYLVHPYRNPILGWPEEVRNLTVANLTTFYRAHYRPDGAVLVVVGDLEPARVLDRVEAHFGTLTAGAARRPAVAATEPRQKGRRGFTLVESDSAPRGLIGWHSVPFAHPDAPALDVLSDLLTCGRRARLWDRLVEHDRLATWVEASQEGAHLAGQFLIQVEAALGATPTAIEAALFEVLAELAHEGPTRAELARSRNRLEAAWRWEQEELAGLAAGLGHVALWGDWRAWQEAHRASLAVTADEIRRVAGTYLVETGLTVGWSLPQSLCGQAADALPVVELPALPPRPAAPPATDAPLGLVVPVGGSTLADYRPRRVVLSNGLRLIYEPRPDTGTVALDLYVDAGQLREAKPGLAHLTGRLREEGTTRRSAEEVAAAVEDVGGTLDVSATGLSLRLRGEDLALALELTGDLTLRPAFPPTALDWLTRRIAAEIQADRDDPAFRADAIFRALVYGDHPYGRDPRGTVRQLGGLRREDVQAHHARFFRPENAFLVCVGDFEPRGLRALVERHLGRWEPGGTEAAVYPQPVRLPKARNRRVAHAGEQVHLLLGHLGIARDDPDFEALMVLDHILGSGPGFTDRLSRILRDELGLAYTVGGGLTDSADLVPGLFRIYVGTGPDEARRAAAVVVEQVTAMHAGAFTADEVDRARRYLAGAWVFDFQTVGQRRAAPGAGTLGVAPR